MPRGEEAPSPARSLRQSLAFPVQSCSRSRTAEFWMEAASHIRWRDWPQEVPNPKLSRRRPEKPSLLLSPL